MGVLKRDGFAGGVLNISFSMRRKEGDILFLQKNLQICSSKRNVPLLPVDWKTISKGMMPANPVCGTNIKAPESAVKGTPGKDMRIP